MSIIFSEVSVLFLRDPHVRVFQICDRLDRQLGNRFSSAFTRLSDNLSVVWERGSFYVLGKHENAIPEQAIWETRFRQLCDRWSELGDFYTQFRWLPTPDKIPATVIAEWSVRLLKKHGLPPVLLNSQNRVRVQRTPQFWSETVQFANGYYPAISLSLKTEVLYNGTLKDAYLQFANSPDTSADLEVTLTGLKVKSPDGGIGEIMGFRGTVGERRDELLAKATVPRSRQALTKASPEEPLVGIRFRRDSGEFSYAMSALVPSLTQYTATRYGLDWGNLLRLTKVSLSERQELLANWKQQIQQILHNYGFKLSRNLNSKESQDCFVKLPSVDDVQLQFGQGATSTSDRILTGLTQGGVYRRHSIYLDPTRPIQISLLKVTNGRDVRFQLRAFRERFQAYGFEVAIVDRQKYDATEKQETQVRAEVEQLLRQMLNCPADIFLIILPQSDRNLTTGSLYDRLYSLLLRQQVASQFIYENTLANRNSFKYVLNQLVPGVLAKLGNIPYILKAPLPIADYYIGFDVSRSRLENRPGSVNACASVRIYDNRGEFINYHLESQATPGEEIPQTLLEKLLPAEKIANHTVLIYRDGKFVGRELENLLEWGRAISAKFILVESRKSQIPRLFEVKEMQLQAPKKGWLLKLSSHSGILVTTEVSSNVGLARPLRLNIRPEGHSASIKAVADTTLKLTLLHHGSLRPPRLPLPLFAADKIAGLHRQGIIPSITHGDRQFWL